MDDDANPPGNGPNSFGYDNVNYRDAYQQAIQMSNEEVIGRMFSLMRGGYKPETMVRALSALLLHRDLYRIAKALEKTTENGGRP